MLPRAALVLRRSRCFSRRPRPNRFRSRKRPPLSLQEWMTSGPIHLATDRRALPAADRRDRSAGSGAAVGHRGQSRRAARSPTRSTPSAGAPGPARAAARHSGPDQGQHRHRRPDDDDRRVAGARGLDRRQQDAFVVGAAARRGRGDPRQDESERVGQLPIDAFDERLERARRAGRRIPYALDRNPCGSSSGTGAAIAANLAAVGVGTETDGSIVCPSGANGARRHQADGRSGQPDRDHSDLAQPGHRRARWRAPSRTRRRCSARWPASIRADPATKRSAAADGRRLRDVARSRRAEGRAHRRRAQAVLRLQRRRPIALIEAAIADMKAQGAVDRRSRRTSRPRRRWTTARSRCCSTSSRRT